MGCIDCMVHAKVLGEVRREMLLWDSIGDRLTAGLSGTISWWCGLGLIVLMSVSSRPARRLLIAAITPPSCWRNLKRYQSVFLANKKQSNSITYMTVKPRLHQGIMLPGNMLPGRATCCRQHICWRQHVARARQQVVRWGNVNFVDGNNKQHVTGKLATCCPGVNAALWQHYGIAQQSVSLRAIVEATSVLCYQHVQRMSHVMRYIDLNLRYVTTCWSYGSSESERTLNWQKQKREDKTEIKRWALTKKRRKARKTNSNNMSLKWHFRAFVMHTPSSAVFEVSMDQWWATN